MLGLSNSVVSAAKTLQEQLVFTYDITQSTGTGGDVTTDESVGGYTGLVKLEDTSTSPFLVFRLTENFDFLENDIVRVEYYIPSSNTDVNSVGNVYVPPAGAQSTDQVNTTDEFVTNEYTLSTSSASTYLNVYASTYPNNNTQNSTEITNDVVYFKSVKVYRVA